MNLWMVYTFNVKWLEEIEKTSEGECNLHRRPSSPEVVSKDFLLFGPEKNDQKMNF